MCYHLGPAVAWPFGITAPLSAVPSVIVLVPIQLPLVYPELWAGERGLARGGEETSTKELVLRYAFPNPGRK